MMRTALLSLLALSVSSQGKEAGPVLMYCTHPVILGHLVMQYIGSASGDASHEGGVRRGRERGDMERIFEGVVMSNSQWLPQLKINEVDRIREMTLTDVVVKSSSPSRPSRATPLLCAPIVPTSVPRRPLQLTTIDTLSINTSTANYTNRSIESATVLCCVPMIHSMQHVAQGISPTDQAS